MNDIITFEAPLLRGRFIVFNQRPDFDFVKVKQTHSSIIVPEETVIEGLEADGILGNTSTPKAILTADCVPLVLLGSAEHTVIHAGWRGLAGNILGQDLVKKINPTYAYIGPHIRPEHYEVQEDFLANFPEYPEAFSRHHGKIFFNLAHVACAQLKKAYPNIVIEDAGLCTFAGSNFHSYRRNKTTERNWNIYIP